MAVVLESPQQAAPLNHHRKSWLRHAICFKKKKNELKTQKKDKCSTPLAATPGLDKKTKKRQRKDKEEDKEEAKTQD